MSEKLEAHKEKMRIKRERGRLQLEREHVAVIAAETSRLKALASFGVLFVAYVKKPVCQ